MNTRTANSISAVPPAAALSRQDASAGRPGRLRYQSPDSRQTLAEGVAELHAATPGLVDEDALDEGARELFHNHDIAHVVFGCSTALRDEAMVDVWTMVGSDVTLRRYMEYVKMEEAKALLREIGWARTVWATVVGLPRMLRTAWRARRMTKKWPWTDHAAYLDRPLAEIRAEFGIRVFTS